MCRLAGSMDLRASCFSLRPIRPAYLAVESVSVSHAMLAFECEECESSEHPISEGNSHIMVHGTRGKAIKKQGHERTTLADLD